MADIAVTQSGVALIYTEPKADITQSGIAVIHTNAALVLTSTGVALIYLDEEGTPFALII